MKRINGTVGAIVALGLKRRVLPWLAAFCGLLGSTGVQAGYSGLFVFGDSLSDSGNNAFVFDYVLGPTIPVPPGTLRTPVPTANNSFVPSYPYATPVGGRYSNGPVWAEVFAGGSPLTGAVASNLGGTNYAYGGARVGPLGAGFPPSLTTQVATFLTQHPQAPANALYVVAGGGNNARDIIDQAAADLANGVDPTTNILSGAAAYAGFVDAMVAQLMGAGATDIVVWNTPNIGVTPAGLARGPLAAGLAASVSQIMNDVLMQELADEVTKGVRIFDLFGLISGVSANPGAYHLSNVADACSAVKGANCGNYLFWDGIHPTAAGHRLLAEAMAAFVPEPDTVVLVALGLIAIVGSRKRRSRH